MHVDILCIAVCRLWRLYVILCSAAIAVYAITIHGRLMQKWAESMSWGGGVYGGGRALFYPQVMSNNSDINYSSLSGRASWKHTAHDSSTNGILLYKCSCSVQSILSLRHVCLSLQTLGVQWPVHDSQEAVLFCCGILQADRHGAE